MSLLDNFIAGELNLANGCTEPGAVAYAVASASQYADNDINELIVELDGYVYKNGLNAGISGIKEYRGNSMAAALAFYLSDYAEKKLEVLSFIDNEVIKKAKLILPKINLRVIDKDHLYIHVIIKSDKKQSECLIEYDHTNLQWIKLNGDFIWKKEVKSDEEIQVDSEYLSDIIRGFSISHMIELIEEDFNETHLSFLRNGLKKNMSLFEAGKNGESSGIGEQYEKIVRGDNIRSIAAKIAHGVDARMSGAPYPALASSGSGNQGITITIGTYEFGILHAKKEKDIFKATLLAHLMAYYTKLFFGKLSAYCGLFTSAAPGLIAAFLYMDEKIDLIEGSINNFYSDLGGVICDGAKASCAYKAISSFEAAYRHYEFSKSGFISILPSGFVSINIKETLQNLSELSIPREKTINDTLVKLIDDLHKGPR
jgi:L-cysteine desulfidase